MRTVLEIVQRAIANGDFEQLLRGEEGYDLDTPYMAPAPLPTDWDALLTKGIYEVYRSEPAAGIDEQLETALVDLTSDARGTYSALNILWCVSLGIDGDFKTVGVEMRITRPDATPATVLTP